MTIAKTELFSNELQFASGLFKALSHPARLEILRYLSEMNHDNPVGDYKYILH